MQFGLAQNYTMNTKNDYLKIKKYISLKICFYVYGYLACKYICVPQCSAGRGQKEASDILELELQVVNDPLWVLGTELHMS